MNSSFCGLKTTSVFDDLFREICVSCRFRPRKRRQFCSFAWTVLLAAFLWQSFACQSQQWSMLTWVPVAPLPDTNIHGYVLGHTSQIVGYATFHLRPYAVNGTSQYPPCASLSTYDEVHKLVIAWWYMVVIDWHDVCRTKCYYPPTHPPQYEEVGPAQKNDIMCCSPGFQTSLFTEKKPSEIIGQNQGMVRWHGQYWCDVSSIIQHRGCSCITIALRWRPLWENPRKKPLSKKDG